MGRNKYSKLFKNTKGFYLIVFLLCGCASLSGSRIEKIEKRNVEYVLLSGSKPVVVFENGLGGEYHWWEKVLPEISKKQTVFAYNRPGYGHSEKAQTPRDARTIVTELRQTLQALELKPPYVLVGHSLGGLYFQYYARRYPQEVKALLLVDSTHPEQMLGDGAINRWPWWIRMAIKTLTPAVGLEELDQIENSGVQVLNLPPLDTTKVPTVILLASEPEKPSSPLEQHAVDKRQDFHRLYPSAHFITVKGDHAIPMHSPQVIIQQIFQLSE